MDNNYQRDQPQLPPTNMSQFIQKSSTPAPTNTAPMAVVEQPPLINQSLLPLPSSTGINSIPPYNLSKPPTPVLMQYNQPIPLHTHSISAQHASQSLMQQPPPMNHPVKSGINVKDALDYLDEVKLNFIDRSEIYNRFLDIMKDFKSRFIDTPDVIERVSTLFRGFPALINGFNTFLPPGYTIVAKRDSINVVVPPGHPPLRLPGTRPLDGVYIDWIQYQTPSLHPPSHDSEAPSEYDYSKPWAPINPANTISAQPAQAQLPKEPPVKRTIEFNQAINYVNKIKNRFVNEPETYKRFLEILQMYQKDGKAVHDVYSHINVLFKNSPDLLDEFKQFLPDTSAPAPSASKTATSTMGVAGKDKRPNTSGGPAKKRTKGGITSSTKTSDSKLGTMEELEFFDKVKRAIGNKSTYNEFLKILNLFSQEIIDNRVLIERVTPFLEREKDLLDWFKRFVKYEDDLVCWNVPVDKVAVDLKNCRASGRSYRLLPSSVPRSACSSRDALCNEVLNDDWISHPVYVSETGFISHKKNAYEEALYKCEEERYEFDRNIEANLHTIAVLEPIAKKVSNMTPEERTKFKLEVGLGSGSKIYQLVIFKVYDKERGTEVIDALHNFPATAVPIVLKRLKQKDEEWKRSQREWNKVWRDLEYKNFYKSLDHQGINFKLSDRKHTSSKNLLQEIETLLKDQKEKDSYMENRYQMDYVFKDNSVFNDCFAILENTLDNVGGMNQADDELARKELISGLLTSLFCLPVANDAIDMDIDRVTGLGITNLSQKNDKKTSDGSVLRSTYSFYSNANIYVLIRLFQMLYARLFRMKEVSHSLSTIPPIAERVNPIALEMGLVKPEQSDFIFDEKKRYEDLLKAIESLLENKIDSIEFEERCRAMFGTSAYLIYTIDKLCQSISKQLQTIVSDSRSMELIALYHHDRERTSTSSRQEAMYRLTSECHVDDQLFRFEYFVAEKVLTIQLLAKDDHFNDESITSEEKWSLYVDHFVQLSATEGVRLKRHEPFLKRNLPITIPEEAPKNIETQSGLELKICVNTYKIFFVDKTEDYFRRKHVQTESHNPARMEKFKALVKNGWVKFIDGQDIEDKSNAMEAFLRGGEGIQIDELPCGRRFRYGGVMAQGEEDDMSDNGVMNASS